LESFNAIFLLLGFSASTLNRTSATRPMNVLA
jgi:hypothetical protein